MAQEPGRTAAHPSDVVVAPLAPRADPALARRRGRREDVHVPAGVAAGHPATAEVGLRVLAAGGSAADAAVAAVLASCVAESILTGLGGGGFATYFDAASRTVTALDFFCAVPGLDADRTAGTMTPIEVEFGGVPLAYEIGGASVAVPGVPAGAAEVHRRWGRLPWRSVVEPAVGLARSGVVLPAAQARTLTSVYQALVPGDGAGIYSPGGRLLEGGDLLFHPGLDLALATYADEGADVFYTGWVGAMMVDQVRDQGGVLGPADLAGYRVRELPVHRARLGGRSIFGRRDLNATLPTLASLPDHLGDLPRGERACVLADAMRGYGRQRLGDTTNVTAVDDDGNACVVTTTLGLGSGVWLPGLGVHLNSMLGEGELLTTDLVAGGRMGSMMCPLVAVGEEGRLELAAGSAGASRIRTALAHTLVSVLLDGSSMRTAIEAPRFHVIDDVVHVEPGYPCEELDALAGHGYRVNHWDHVSHYFGGVSGVGLAGSAGDPRRGGVGLLLR
jgi:gamma-glutamyltranspeptidase/glutathione hydrolase